MRGFNATVNRYHLLQAPLSFFFFFFKSSPFRILHEKVNVKGKGNIKYNWEPGETHIFLSRFYKRHKNILLHGFLPQVGGLITVLKISKCFSKSRVNCQATSAVWSSGDSYLLTAGLGTIQHTLQTILMGDGQLPRDIAIPYECTLTAGYALTQCPVYKICHICSPTDCPFGTPAALSWPQRRYFPSISLTAIHLGCVTLVCALASP